MTFATLFPEQHHSITNCCGPTQALAFHHASLHWKELADTLNLTDHGRAGPDNNANVVRYIHHPQHGEGILKVSITPAYNEGPLLHHYSTHHRRTPTLHGYGTLPNPHQADYPWVWTSLIPGKEPTNPLHPSSITAGTQLAQHLREPHTTIPHIPNLHTPLPSAHNNLLHTLTEKHDTLHQLLTQSFPDPHELTHILNEWNTTQELLLHHLHSPLPTLYLIHADLRSRNTIANPHDTTLYAIDPYGGVGPAETDIAIWISIAAAQHATSPYPAIRIATETDPTLNYSFLTALITAHILILAADEQQHPGFLKQNPTEVTAALFPIYR